MKSKDTRYEDRKNRKRNIIWALFIIIIMVSSVLGYIEMRTDEESKYSYNGFKFAKQNDKFVTTINNKDYVFDYFPTDIQNISIKTNNFNSQKVYLVFNASERDQNLEYVLSKVSYTLNSLGYSIVFACAEEKDCPDIPIVKCAEEKDAVLFKKNNSTEKIYTINKCNVIEGDAIGLVKASDRFNYHILGVMP